MRPPRCKLLLPWGDERRCCEVVSFRISLGRLHSAGKHSVGSQTGRTGERSVETMATLGQYELLREIGEGGMATVYEAVDPVIGRTVALKVLTLPFYLSPGQRPILVERLMREARAAGRLNHPNIVTIYTVGDHDGQHFIAMEYLPGQT